MMRQHKDKVWYNLGFKYQRLGYSKKQKQIYVFKYDQTIPFCFPFLRSQIASTECSPVYYLIKRDC